MALPAKQYTNINYDPSNPSAINVKLDFKLYTEIDNDTQISHLIPKEQTWHEDGLSKIPADNNIKSPDFKFRNISIPQYKKILAEINLALARQPSDKQKRIIEAYKLQLMKSFYIHLHEGNDPDLKKPEEPQKYVLARKIAVGVFTLFGLVLDGAGSFLFCNATFSLIPGISNPVLFGSSIACTLLNGALFYTFEANMLRKAFGVSMTDPNTELMLKSINEQVDLTHKINTRLKDINFLANVSGSCKEYIEIAQSFNTDIVEKKKSFTQQPEPFYLKALKIGLTVFGGLMAIASGYFYTTSLLSVVAASLVSTPLGIVINAVGAFIALAFYASMRASGMMNLGGTSIKLFEKIQEKIIPFDKEKENELLDNALENAKRLSTDIISKQFNRGITAEKQLSGEVSHPSESFATKVNEEEQLVRKSKDIGDGDNQDAYTFTPVNGYAR